MNDEFLLSQSTFKLHTLAVSRYFLIFNNVNLNIVALFTRKQNLIALNFHAIHTRNLLLSLSPISTETAYDVLELHS